MRATVVCSMRNEGPFIVEWVAWYRMLGFTDLVIVTNDCTDRSPQLLDALHKAGVVHHIRHDVPDGQKVCARKLAAAHQTRIVRRSDWVMVCDVDEFLVIHRGDGLLPDLLAGREPGFLGMSVNWRVFGTGGNAMWEDGLTHRQFTQAAPLDASLSAWVKSIHGRPRDFARLAEHGPRVLTLGRGEGWGEGALRWVNGDGDTVPDWRPSTTPYMRELPKDLVSWRDAQVNHYMVRSVESYGLKKGTLSSVRGVDRYTDTYFRRADRNDHEDVSALRYRDAFDALHGGLMSLPDVARLHHLCCADYAGRLAAKALRRPDEDPRWRQHMDMAAQMA